MDSLKSGYMTKCGKTVKSWKKRWFVLKANGFLYYFTDPSCKTEKGHIDIINCGRLSPWNVAEGDKLSDPSMESRTFLIVCSDRTYTCVCDTDVECRSWLGTLHKVHSGSEPQHYPSPTYAKSEPPPVAMTTAPPMHAATQQIALGPAAPPMPQHSPQMPQRCPPMPQPPPQQPPPYTQQPPPYMQHGNTLPRQPHHPPPPPDYRHSFSGPPPPQPAYYPPPVAQPRYGAPPPQPGFCAPPPQPRPYYPPPASQPGPYAPRPPAYYSPRPPPAQFAPRPYMPPPQQPRVAQQQQTNVVVVKL